MSLKEINKSSIVASFSILKDPRKHRNQDFSVFEIITISILAILCGADDWVNVSQWAEINHDWLRQIDICNKKIPSHDTFSRFFRYVDPKEFEKCFIQWTQKVAKAFQEVIAIDGKTICNSKDDTQRAIHIVSAFATKNELILCQLSTEKKSNEIKAFPMLIRLLDIKNSVITIDAAGCQKNIAKLIKEKEGDYVLAVKKNQRTLFYE